MPEWTAAKGCCRIGPRILPIDSPWLTGLSKSGLGPDLWQHASGKTQKLRDLGGFQRRREEKALAVTATQVAKQVILLWGFDSLCYNVHLEGPGQLDDGSHDLERLIALRHAAHKGAVDLEHVERERVQVIQRTIASAEIIHVQRDAELMQAVQHADRGAEIRE